MSQDCQQCSSLRHLQASPRRSFLSARHSLRRARVTVNQSTCANLQNATKTANCTVRLALPIRTAFTITQYIFIAIAFILFYPNRGKNVESTTKKLIYALQQIINITQPIWRNSQLLDTFLYRTPVPNIMAVLQTVQLLLHGHWRRGGKVWSPRRSFLVRKEPYNLCSYLTENTNHTHYRDYEVTAVCFENCTKHIRTMGR